jgi:hypothetical protein
MGALLLTGCSASTQPSTAGTTRLAKANEAVATYDAGSKYGVVERQRVPAGADPGTFGDFICNFEPRPRPVSDFGEWKAGCRAGYYGLSSPSG